MNLAAFAIERRAITYSTIALLVFWPVLGLCGMAWGFQMNDPMWGQTIFLGSVAVAVAERDPGLVDDAVPRAGAVGLPVGRRVGERAARPGDRRGARRAGAAVGHGDDEVV